MFLLLLSFFSTVATVLGGFENSDLLAVSGFSDLRQSALNSGHSSACVDGNLSCARNGSHSNLPEVAVLNYTPGCAYSYHYVAGTRLTMAAMLQKKDEEPENTRTRALVTLDAQVAIETIGKTQDGDLVFELIVSSAIVDNGNDKYPLTAQLNESPFYFVQTTGGRVKEVIFNDRESEQFLDVKRDIASMFDFKAVNEPTLAEEEHPDASGGVMKVQYLEVEKKDHVEYHRSKAGHVLGSLSGLTLSQEKIVNISRAEGVIHASAMHEKHSSGHLKASDQVEEASSGGLKSFVFRAKTSARALFVSKQCRTAEKQEAAALLLFAGASGVISHVAGSLPSSRASFRVGSLEMSGSRLATKLDESDNSDTRYAEFLTPITRSRARMTAVGKQVQSWLKTIPTLVATLSTDSASAGTLKQMLSGDSTGRVAHLLGDMLMGRPKDAAFGARDFVPGETHARLANEVKRAIVRALVECGDAASQSVIVEYASGASASDTDFILSALMTMPRTTADLAQYVHQLAIDDSKQSNVRRALVASVLSSVAGRLQHSHPFHVSARNLALSKLQSAILVHDLWGQELALVMLGNIGSRKDVTTISNFLNSRSRPLREQAAISLRRISGNDVTRLLGEHFLSEAHQMVRLAALSSLTSRNLPRTFWADLVQKLRSGALSLPPLSKSVAQKLRGILQRHGFELSLRFLPRKSDLKVLEDFEEGEDDDGDDSKSSDLLKMIEIGLVTDDASAKIPRAGGFDISSMWGEERCENMDKGLFEFNTAKSFGFGASSFTSNLETTVIGRGFAGKKEQGQKWCATIGGKSSNDMEILGKKLDIFDFKAEAQYDSANSNGPTRLALIVFGFQIALPQSKAPPSIVDKTAVVSTLCGSVDSQLVYPMPDSLHPTSVEKGWRNFNQDVTVHWGVLSLRWSISLDFQAAVFFEPCKTMGEGYMAAGVEPRIRVRSSVESGVNIGLIGAGVALDVNVLSGDILLSSLFGIDEKSEKKNGGVSISPTANKGIAIHLNRDTLSGDFRSFSRALSLKTPQAELRFPADDGVVSDLQLGEPDVALEESRRQFQTIFERCVDEDGQYVECGSGLSPDVQDEPEDVDRLVVNDNHTPMPPLPDHETARIARKEAEQERDRVRDNERRAEDLADYETRKNNAQTETIRMKAGQNANKQGLLARDATRNAGRRLEAQSSNKLERKLAETENDAERDDAEVTAEGEREVHETEDEVHKLDHREERHDERAELRRDFHRDQRAASSTLGIMERMGQRNSERRNRKKEKRHERQVGRSLRRGTRDDQVDAMFGRESRLNSRQFSDARNQMRQRNEMRSVRRNFKKGNGNKRSFSNLQQTLEGDQMGSERRREISRFEKDAKTSVDGNRSIQRSLEGLGKKMSRSSRDRAGETRRMQSRLSKNLRRAQQEDRRESATRRVRDTIRDEEMQREAERDNNSLERSVQEENHDLTRSTRNEKTGVLHSVSSQETRANGGRKVRDLSRTANEQGRRVREGQRKRAASIRTLANRKKDERRFDEEVSRSLRRVDRTADEQDVENDEVTGTVRREGRQGRSSLDRRQLGVGRRREGESDRRGLRRADDHLRLGINSAAGKEREMLKKATVATQKAAAARGRLQSLLEHPDLQNEIVASVAARVEGLVDKANRLPLPGEGAGQDTDLDISSDDDSDDDSDDSDDDDNKPITVPEDWAKKEKKKVLGEFADRAVGLYAGARRMYKQGAEMDQYVAKVMVKARKVWATAGKYFTRFERYRDTARKLIATIKAGMKKLKQYSARATKWGDNTRAKEAGIANARKSVKNLEGAAGKMKRKFKEGKGMMSAWANEVDQEAAKANNALNVLEGKRRSKKLK